MNREPINTDVLVVGAGFAGATVARELATTGRKVTVIEKRNHIAGNAYDEINVAGLTVHKYGPHVFHTNSNQVFRWLSNFTDWKFYEHRVLSSVEGLLLPIPINRTTINKLYRLNLTKLEVQEFLTTQQEHRTIKNSEDVVLNAVGPDLCNLFFRGYTKKQWGLELSELAAGVAARIPTRTDDDDRYFTDLYQFMPSKGYTEMFRKILDHKNIKTITDRPFIKSLDAYKTLIYTGPIDEYFDYRFGKLPYRSIIFEHITHDTTKYQSVGTVNYPNDHEYTRITEFKHLTGEISPKTSIVKEFPSDAGDPYYPIPRSENEQIYKEYQLLAEHESNVHFVGRLAQYKYFNMDQVVAASLKLSKKISSDSPEC